MQQSKQNIQILDQSTNSQLKKATICTGQKENSSLNINVKLGKLKQVVKLVNFQDLGILFLKPWQETGYNFV